jgi:hypothetical protein
MAQENGDQPKAMVREETRNKLSLLCPGFGSCAKSLKTNCHSVCQGNAISHTWDGSR